MTFKTKIFAFSILIAALFVAAKMAPPLREVENTTFTNGEFMKYRVHYGVINAGNVTLELRPEAEVINGRKCFHVVGKGFTNSSYDWVYKIRDRYESYVDEKALVPWRFVRDINEGSFKSYTETRFDHNLGKAFYLDEQHKVTTHDVPVNTQDVVSAFYFARTANRNTLKIGDKLPLTSFLDRKLAKVNALLLAREIVIIDGKKFKGLKFKLVIEEKGFSTDGSKINFWISDDENKIPLRVETELAIGSIKADLVEWKNLKNPFSAKIN